MFSLDICFIKDKFVKFINRDMNILPFQYTTSKQKVVIPKKIPSNTQILKPCFVDKIKDICTEKAHKNICLVIQTNNNKDPNLILM